MISDNIKYTVEGDQAVIETVQILLEAQSEKDEWRANVLLNGFGYHRNKCSLWSCTCSISRLCTRVLITQFPLIAGLFKLWMKYDANKTIERYGGVGHYIGYIIDAAVYQILINELRSTRVTDSFHAMMDGLGHIFGSILLAGGYVFWNESCDDDNGFLKSFIVVARYSSKPGHSNTLARLMLKGLSGAKLYRISRELSARFEAMTDTSDDLLRTSTSNALESVRGVETPYRLKHIARHTILLALLGRDLPTAEALGIPKQLENYLAFK